jgi:predicted ATPase/class 3 adenylate cyclase/DNA-binding CsgD family transcriptional regulator
MRELPTGTVTLLFTDIEGSTRLLQQLGERYASVLAECRVLLQAVFQRFHGHEVDTQGDAFFVAFARATDAVAAAVVAQRTLASHPWPEDVTIRVRMGLHTGEPDRSTESYVGLDVHHAARIMGAGHGGQVLLSETTRDLVAHSLPEGVSLLDVGAHRLKDLQHPSHLFQLVMAGLPADFPPLRTLDSSPNNLPLQPTPFIGRQKEVDAIGQLLLREEVHLVTLTGPGGVGKTRLALQVAAELSEHFPDGTWFVSLAPISDPDLVIPTLTQTLGLREARDQVPLEHLKGSLHEKKTLLLLDNFEQVVSAAMLIADLLTVCPRLKVLVTSREGLHVRAEREFPVPALALPDARRLPDLLTLSQYEAVALFIERAQAVKPDFQVTNANAPAVAEICTRLDGLPLAIELAAARSKLFPPQALLTRLEQRLPLLTRSARDVPARQQTLRQTIQWSYDLLSAQEQRLFRRLTVFAGGCSWQAIEAVSAACQDDTTPVLEAVASLIDKNLLQQTAPEGEELRLMMLETIREYGLEALATSGEMEVIRQAHATYYLQVAEEAEPELGGLQAVVALERLEQELDNLRAVMRWSLEREEMGGSIEIALRLGAALWQFWRVRGHVSEGRTFLEQALVKSKGIEAPVRVKALIAAARLADSQDDTDRAEALCDESLALCRELGDTRGIALSLHLLGKIASWRSNLGVAESEEALALFREVGDKDGIASSLADLAHHVYHQGEYARAMSLHEEALVLWREVGHKDRVAQSYVCVAEMLFFSQGDPARVYPLLDEGLALSRELGYKLGIAKGITLSGELALSQGDAALARCLIEQSLVLCRETGNQEDIARSLFVLGRVVESLGDYAAARALYEESLAIRRVVGDNRHIASCLEGLAGLFVTQGEPVMAVQLWGAAEALREARGTPIPPVYRAAYARSVAAARAQLGEKAFAPAWAQGRSMTLDQVLAAQGQAIITTPTAAAPAAPAPVKPAAAYPNGLTAREVEMLRLVAQGLTDAHIAEQLVISPRTVNTHLTSIYSKIQVSSRAAATHYAMEHHLV